MSEMSPLARLVLLAIRALAILSAFCAALFLAIQVWMNWFSGATRVMAYRDYAFLAVLVLLLFGCLWLARAVGRELKPPSS